jgi:D-alanyl-D-alanine carboxypeptidase
MSRVGRCQTPVSARGLKRRRSRADLTNCLGAVALAAITLGLAVPAQAFEARVQKLPPSVRAQLTVSAWRLGCPVPLSQLRLLTVPHWGFDGNEHMGRLVVNADHAAQLGKVFGRLHKLRFQIRHLQLADSYGPIAARPNDNDVSASFECRQAVPSPCSGGTGTGTWSRHAFGLAIDLNPRENPYVGCGKLRDPSRRPFLDRSRVRPGMVTPAVVAAFREIGWSWGGAWTGDTKDYMHFSASGR